jgi:hypothetical protein
MPKKKKFKDDVIELNPDAEEEATSSAIPFKSKKPMIRKRPVKGSKSFDEYGPTQIY